MENNFYNVIAKYYDELQDDINPHSWAKELDSIIKKYGSSKGKELLDLGCGDGRIDEELYKLGYKITGIDSSEGMLSRAKKKLPDCTWSLEDITNLQMDRSFDICTCLLDTVNHILEPSDVADMIEGASGALISGGLLIFDIATYNHFSSTLADNVFYNDYDDFTLLWVNDFDDEEMINYAELTLFEKDSDSRYRRYDGVIEERYYDSTFIGDIASEAGLMLQAEIPSEDSQRVFLIFKKVEK